MRRRAKGLRALRAWVASGTVTPSMRKEWSKRRKAAARARALLLLGPFCKRCGINDERVLQIDHIVPVGQHHADRQMGETFYRRIIANPNEFQRLCANCNIIKAIENEERGHKKRIIIGGLIPQNELRV